MSLLCHASKILSIIFNKNYDLYLNKIKTNLLTDIIAKTGNFMH